MKKVVFVGANILFEPIIKIVSENSQVTVCEESFLTVPDGVAKYDLKKSFIGLRSFSEVSLPFYQIGLNDLLKKIKPDTIVVMDFIRLWYWQVIWYKFWNKEVKVIVYVETQRQPKNFLGMIGFSIFWLFFKITESLVYIYAVYTELGEKFALSSGVKTRIKILPIPIDCNHFTSKNTDVNYYHNNEFKLLLNARYVSYKKHIDVFKALLYLKRETNHKIKLTCIGRGGDKKQIIDIAKKLGIESEVEFIDPVDRFSMVSVYQAHDALVLPSDGEAIGMVVPEAMACGLPTITSDTVGANIYVKHGVTGFIFKTGDVKDLALAIDHLCSGDVLETMSRNARSHVANFSLNNPKLLDLFKKTIIFNE